MLVHGVIRYHVGQGYINDSSHSSLTVLRRSGRQPPDSSPFLQPWHNIVAVQAPGILHYPFQFRIEWRSELT
jgi:hypothetical protein